VSARLVATGHPADLYDWATYTHVLANQVPGPEGLLYLPVYPPVLALLLAPLGLLPYLFALATWTAISAAAYLAAGTWLVAKVPGLRRDPVSAGLLLIAFPAFPQLLLYGQVSALAMLLVAAGWRGWTTGHNALAGVALGALVFKPQMLCLALSASLLAPGWALIGGAAIAIAIELLGTGLLLGPDVYWGYAETLRRMLAHPGAFEPKAEQIQSLRGFLLALGGDSATTTVLFVAGIVALSGRGAREQVTGPHGRFELIDESYNANPASMASAIAVLGQVKPEGGRRIAVLGDMLELGPTSPQLHAGLNAALRAARIDRVFAAGPLMRNLWDALAPEMRGVYGASSKEIAEAVANDLRAGDVVMIKGSYGSKMVVVVERLKTLAQQKG